MRRTARSFSLRQIIIPALVGGWLAFAPHVASAQSFLAATGSFWESTYLIEATQDSGVASKARELRGGGFETASGDYVDFGGWYSPEWYDTRATWLTQISPSFGIVWGVSTGEQAPKYTIAPSLQWGFMYQAQPIKNSTLTLKISTTLGGELRERTCVADYGEIGGVQEVNCRLAATTLTPVETLSYLTYAKPPDTWQITFKYFF